MYEIKAKSLFRWLCLISKGRGQGALPPGAEPAIRLGCSSPRAWEAGPPSRAGREFSRKRESRTLSSDLSMIAVLCLTPLEPEPALRDIAKPFVPLPRVGPAMLWRSFGRRNAVAGRKCQRNSLKSPDLRKQMARFWPLFPLRIERNRPPFVRKVTKMCGKSRRKRRQLHASSDGVADSALLAPSDQRGARSVMRPLASFAISSPAPTLKALIAATTPMFRAGEKAT